MCLIIMRFIDGIINYWNLNFIDLLIYVYWCCYIKKNEIYLTLKKKTSNQIKNQSNMINIKYNSIIGLGLFHLGII